MAERQGYCLWSLKLLMNPTVLYLFLHPIFKPTKPLCNIMSEKSESYQCGLLQPSQVTPEQSTLSKFNKL